MRSFAIRPLSTALLSVHLKSSLLSRLALAATFALATMQVHHVQAAEPAEHASGTLTHAVQLQLRHAVTDDKALLQAWYGSRNFEPLWVTSAGLTAKGKAAVQALAQVGNEGLPPARYDLSALTTATSVRSLASQAELEVAISLAVQTYLHDLKYGAANPHAPGFGVEGLAAVEKVGFSKAVAEARPTNPRYGQLSNQLKADRASKTDKSKVRETILSLEKLRWEQHDGKAGSSFAQLNLTVNQ